jgi:hypothetical protein
MTWCYGAGFVFGIEIKESLHVSMLRVHHRVVCKGDI